MERNEKRKKYCYILIIIVILILLSIFIYSNIYFQKIYVLESGLNFIELDVGTYKITFEPSDGCGECGYMISNKSYYESYRHVCFNDFEEINERSTKTISIGNESDGIMIHIYPGEEYIKMQINEPWKESVFTSFLFRWVIIAVILLLILIFIAIKYDSYSPVEFLISLALMGYLLIIISWGLDIDVDILIDFMVGASIIWLVLTKRDNESKRNSD